ncbi:MAG TPA: hypothetical protein VJL38_01600, partial [Patescibacteria group bacterium]|nr:hypothetical protein [Patescibacteria group bacterium]
TDGNGFKELNTIGLIPIIVKSIQDQQGIIETQTDNIFDISLKTDQNITTLAQLQTSVDEQLLSISEQFATLDQQLTVNNEQLTVNNEQLTVNSQQDARVTAIETLMNQLQLDANAQASKISLLETQMQTITDFFLALNPDTLLYKDSLGNIDLGTGTLVATGVETGILTINIADPLAPTIGEGIITAGTDYATIETQAVAAGSKVFVTFTDDLGGRSFFIAEKKDGESFTVRISTPVIDEAHFDWWIVEQK